TAAAVESIKAMSARGDMLVGAGTVLTAEQVDAAVDAGASYIVSPGFSEAVVRRCTERGVLPLPGTVTATEIQAALAAGLQAAKVFPAQASGGAPGSRRWPARSVVCSSSPPAASARRTWPSTPRSPPCWPSAAAGWCLGMRSPPATLTASPP